MNRSEDRVARVSLDPENQRVHRDGRELKLTPKAFAVLRYLMDRLGRLAMKEDLFAAVWPDTAVSESALSTCIREIRRTLDDDAAAPRYIQTVHRRGYRYIGPAADADVAEQARRMSSAPLVGRERELASLARALSHVQRGGQRLVFLGGEAGIGKTALVDHFVAETAQRGTAQIARGQCVDQYGACEAYLPWFDVLNIFARACGRERVAALLRRCAPMWLAQLPWLVNDAERTRLRQEIAGATSERMIRELADALEALCDEKPVLVILEDLHWSDPSSIGLLAYVARRQQPGRILVLATYRRAELHVGSHPLLALKQELLLHDACEDISLEFLTREAVAEYVRLRLPGAPDDLAAQVHRRTDGNPLFVVNLIDYFVARGALVHERGQWQLTAPVHAVQTEVPDSLKAMIALQLNRLSPDDRRVLEAASVAGARFSAAAVAAALDESVETAEEHLAALTRSEWFVRGAERHTWPDGTESDGYAFIHELYQNVLYERIGINRRSRMHRQLGERLEAAYGGGGEDLASELAMHFQRGRDPKRAVSNFAQAGESAIRRSAYVEAIALLERGITLLASLPEGSERDEYELRLRAPLGVSYMNLRGYAAEEAGMTFARAHTLCRGVADPGRVLRVLRGVWIFALQRADLRRACTVAEELLHVAQRERDVAGLVEAHRIMATTWFHLGNFSSALAHLQQGLELYDVTQHSSHAFLYGQDPGVCCNAWHAWTLWHLGYPDQAVTSARRSIELARRIGHPFTLSYALNFAACVYLWRHELANAETCAGESVACAQEHGLTSMLAAGEVLHGCSRTFLRVSDGAVRELERGVARWRSTGARLMTPYWMYLLGSALNQAGRPAEALGVLNEAEGERTDERWLECELYILRALIRRGHEGRSRRDLHAQTDLHRALNAATEMKSPSLRLRAANALSLLLCEQGKPDEARNLLGSAYAAFTEGFQTADLANARKILARL